MCNDLERETRFSDADGLHNKLEPTLDGQEGGNSGHQLQLVQRLHASNLLSRPSALVPGGAASISRSDSATSSLVISLNLGKQP